MTEYIDVSLPRNPPREIPASIQLARGLRGYFFFGGLALVGSLGVLASLMLPPHEPGVIVFKLFGAVFFFGGVGSFFLRTAIRKLALRKSAIHSGEVVVGRVTDRGRSFNPFSSSGYYTLTVDFARPDGQTAQTELRSTAADLHATFALESELLGFYDLERADAFFPAEIGVLLQCT